MKKKFVNTLIVTLALIVGLTAASCAKKPENLESFIQSNEDVKKQIQEAADAAGLTVDIQGNEATYTFDLSTIEGADEDTLKDPAMQESLKTALDGTKSTFVSLCKRLEEETGFTGIKIIVNYTYGDEVLISQTFTSAD